MIIKFVFNRAWRPLIRLMVILLVFGNGMMAQVSISGPQCIIPGIPYQYIITGNWDASSKMKVCIRGGKMENGEQCSAKGKIVNTLFITWNDTSHHQLELNSSLGNIKLKLKKTTELSGGTVIEKNKVKSYGSTTTSFTFNCQPARGGACDPVYTYLWQQSENGLNWINIAGADKKDLKFTGMVNVNTYFRRVTTEAGSNLTAYSDNGVITVEFK